VQSYVWGLDLSGSLQGAGGVGGLVAVRSTGSPARFAVFDGNGNVMALVNGATGQIDAQYEYGPFGEVLRASGPVAKANPFRFSTKYQDDETEFLYYGYRYYDARNGGWVNRDPVGETGGANLYGFVHNPTVNASDRLGLDYSWPGGSPPGHPPSIWPELVRGEVRRIAGTDSEVGGPLATAEAIDVWLRKQPFPCAKVKPGKDSGDYNHCMFGCLLGLASMFYAPLSGSGLSELTDFQLGDLWSDYVGSFWGLFPGPNASAQSCKGKCKEFVCCK